MSRPSLCHPDVMLATWLGSGYLPKAPGTWGTLAALPFALLIGYYSGFFGLGLATLAAFVMGLWAAKGYMQRTQTHDPGAVVIDEVAGIWLTCLPLYWGQQLPLNWGSMIWVAIAFGLFRIFDIFKPWPVSWADNLPGALGVMLDDILAGLYAGAILFTAYHFWS